MIEPADFGWRMDVLRRSERVRSPEFVARLLLMFVGTAAGTLLLGLEMLPLWLGLYYGTVCLEKLVLWKWAAAQSRSFFYLMVAISVLNATTYAALPVHLWLEGPANLQFVAMVLLIGGVLNVFLVRARVWQISAAYMVPLGLAFLCIAASYYEAPGGGAVFYSAVAMAIAIIFYFLIAVYEANAAHRKLLEAQAQFFQAQKMEAIGTLAGGISHDFNNLLSVVQGNLELLQQPGGEQNLDIHVSEALTACWRGAGLTRQLLSLGRTSALVPQRINPGKVLHEVERLVRRVVPASIGLVCEADRDLPDVMADETTLQAALLNLAINARDAMPGGGRMRFEACTLAPDMPRPASLPSGPLVALSLSDTGEGIRKVDLPRIFDPFFTTKPKGRGTGLGLAMVEGFTRQSGGHVVAESEHGEGSRVTIYLPAQPDVGAHVPKAEPGCAAVSVPAPVASPDALRGSAREALSPQRSAAVARSAPLRRTS